VNRTLRKAVPEILLAITVTVIGVVLDDPELAALVGPTGVVVLQAVRRVIRDSTQGQPR